MKVGNLVRGNFWAGMGVRRRGIGLVCKMFEGDGTTYCWVHFHDGEYVRVRRHELNEVEEE